MAGCFFASMTITRTKVWRRVEPGRKVKAGRQAARHVIFVLAMKAWYLYVDTLVLCCCMIEDAEHV